MSCAKNELGILARRKIEAEIIKPIYQILVREIGKARAQAVIGEAIENAAIEAGKQFAAQEPNGADLRSFAALQYLWEKDDALRVEVINQDAQHFDYNVTRCRYAEMYHEMGLGRLATCSPAPATVSLSLAMPLTSTCSAARPSCPAPPAAISATPLKRQEKINDVSSQRRAPVAKPADDGAVRRHRQ